MDDMTKKLTPIQRDLYNYLRDFGSIPQIVRIAYDHGLAPATVHARLNAMEIKGYIGRDSDNRRVLVEKE